MSKDFREIEIENMAAYLEKFGDSTMTDFARFHMGFWYTDDWDSDGGCGTIACIAGHWQHVNPDSELGLRWIGGEKSVCFRDLGELDALKSYFDGFLTGWEVEQIFMPIGYSVAGVTPRMAAEKIRQVLASRTLELEME